MDFPPDWTVLTTDEYETATPRITIEICAQLRPSRRILDNFRVDPWQLPGGSSTTSG
jgi:hypothetical protein